MDFGVFQCELVVCRQKYVAVLFCKFLDEILHTHTHTHTNTHTHNELLLCATVSAGNICTIKALFRLY
jgi:hypothetical protein